MRSVQLSLLCDKFSIDVEFNMLKVDQTDFYMHMMIEAVKKSSQIDALINDVDLEIEFSKEYN